MLRKAKSRKWTNLSQDKRNLVAEYLRLFRKDLPLYGLDLDQYRNIQGFVSFLLLAIVSDIVSNEE